MLQIQAGGKDGIPGAVSLIASGDERVIAAAAGKQCHAPAPGANRNFVIGSA